MAHEQRFRSFMAIAIDEAEAASARGEVPVGAVIVGANNAILARAGNETRARNDPTAHAEILVIRAACDATGSERLIGASLWVTLEPCAMCAAAISFARIERLYFGASDPKSGGVLHGATVFNAATTHHKPEIFSGIDQARCSELLQGFFRERR